MERLIIPALDGGVPYINQDFFFILQENNLLSYKSFIETINDTSGEGNTGIIIKGVKNKTPIGQQAIVNFDFTNSMIYLDGDFLEPRDSLSQNDNYQITATKFYLIKWTEEEEREKKVTGFFETVLEKNYFDITTIQPQNEAFIEIEIKDNQNICSRYLDRILRYFNTESGQIQMTFKKNFFDSTGLGFGEMFGFRITNGEGLAPQLTGRFLIGLDRLTSTSPEFDPSSSELNYAKLKNIGGVERVTILPENLPEHNHKVYTENSNNQLRHSHEINVTDYNTTGGSFVLFGKSTKLSTFQEQPVSYVYKSFRTANRLNLTDDPLYGPISSKNYKPSKNTTSYNTQQNIPTKIWNHGPKNPTFLTELTDLENHTHTLVSDGQTIPHNNLPPYVDIIYYEKINPYI